MKKANWRLQVLLGAISFATVIQGASAGGFQVRLHSSPLMGTAYAGNAAIGNEISAMVDNPANLAYSIASQVAASITPIWPTIKFRTDAGASIRDSGASAVVPSGYASWNFSNKWKFGAALTTPFGLKTDYPAASQAGPFNMLTDLLTEQLTVVAAYKVNDIVSLGAGLQGMYSNAELTKVAVISAANSAPLIGSRVKGKGWSAGGVVGLIVQPTCSTRIGLAYNFNSSTKVRGNLKFNALVAGVTPPASASAEANVKYPDFTTLSVHHQINDQWAAMASLIYTGWSKFKELRLKFSNGTSDVTNFDFRDTWFWSIGATYKPAEHWVLRAGIGLDESAVKSDTSRHPSVPDSRRKWLTCGATYTFSKNWDLTVSYAHEFVSRTRVDNTKTVAAIGNNNVLTAVSRRLSGDFNQHIDFVGLQLRYTF